MKYILILSLVLSSCGGQVGTHQEGDSGVAAPSTVQEEDSGPDPACAVLDAYWAALARSGCVDTAPGSSAAETAKEGHSCTDSAAALDACFASADCRLPYEAKLLTTCTGLVPWWPGLRGTE